jgi:dienelactone hydrolase
MMGRWRTAAIAVAILFLLFVTWLARLQHGGPAHQDVELSGGIPGTIYLPGPGNPFYTLFPPPPAQRPPVVVLMHGFMSDRVMMSTLARRLAENGYAVLAIDANGHGDNRNPFADTMTRSDALRDDFKAAVDFLRHFDLVDASRIVVMGHSMGAGATLDFATHEPDLTAAVMISGGWTLGPLPPRNALFIFAEHDPVEAIQGTSTAIAEHLTGVTQIEMGKQYGDFGQGTAVEAVRMPGENHISMVYSGEVATTIVKWLDDACGVKRAGKIKLRDPRLRVRSIALLLFVCLLVAIGRLSGSVADHWEERTADGGWRSELIFAIALVAAMPLIATILPAQWFPLVVGDAQISWFATASVIAIAYLAFTGRLDWNVTRLGIGRTLLAAALAFAAIYLGLNVLSVTLHRLSLTPERLLMMIVGSVILLPFWYAFELLVRRGGVVISTVYGVIGRILIIAFMGIGVSLGILPFVIMLVLPILAPLLITFEVFAAAAYSTSRNLALIAIVETLWFVWLIAATNPIAFKL